MSPVSEPALNYLRLLTGNSGAAFHPGQWEAILAVLAGRRQAIIERTGWGKAAVYFIAAKLLRDRGEGPALLISPLLSLMRNQIEAARRMGVNAVTINCTNVKDWDRIKEDLGLGRVDLLLISPERLGMDDFFEELMTLIDRKISLLVVDEAHCISDWGHDFRPDYLRIRQIIGQLSPTLPVLATTATANDRVEQDICRQLGPGLLVTRGAMLRTSLRLQNLIIPDLYERLAWLAGVLKQIDGTGIVYVLTKRHAEDVSEWLNSQDIPAFAYHSDSGSDGQGPSREELENMLLQNRLKALVATVALGMGFDKPDLAFVIHFHRPASVIHYYQQVGRAGRGIADALGILVEGSEDQQIAEYFIRQAFPPPEHVALVLEAIERSPTGLTAQQLYRRLNLKKSQIDQVLKLFQYETPSPVVRKNKSFVRTADPYAFPAEKVASLTELRHREQATMREYLRTGECLMAFLARELDDAVTAGKRCGRCANCLGRPLIDYHPSPEEIRQAADFLQRRPIVIEPRKRLPAKDLMTETRGITYSLTTGKLVMEPGRALSYYNFGSLGKLVKAGYGDGHYGDELVEAAVRLIREKWFPEQPPPFTGVAAVPSSQRPQPVADFARRLAERLHLPFLPVLVATGRKQEKQRSRQSSITRLTNLDGEYRVEPGFAASGDLLLVDDLVESRWTLTLTAALLKKHGVAGRVYPFALAVIENDSPE